MDIQIYTLRGCGSCTKIKELLSRIGVPYRENLIGRDISKEEFLSQYPDASGYPQMIVDGNHVGGLMDSVKFFVENKMISSKKS